MILCLIGVIFISALLFSYYLPGVILRIFSLLSTICMDRSSISAPGSNIPLAWVSVISSQESQLHLLVSVAVMCLLLF